MTNNIKQNEVMKTPSDVANKLKKPIFTDYLRSYSMQYGVITIEVCDYCPVGCAHCHSDCESESEYLIDINKLTSCIKKFSGFPDAKYVFCTGGEPFSCPSRLIKILKAINNCGLKSYTLTSGYWAKDLNNAKKFLKKFPFIEIFGVSIDLYHTDKIGMERPINAIRASVALGYKTIVWIGHMGLDDPFRQLVLDEMGEDLAVNVEVLYYPLLGRGRGFFLPRLKDRDLSRPASDPCYMVGSPVILSNGSIMSCCNTIQANSIRNGNTFPLHIGDIADFMDATNKYIKSQFTKAIRTVGPVNMAIECKIDVPEEFNGWDICRACEFLQAEQNYRRILYSIKKGAISSSRMNFLDEYFSNGSSCRLIKFLFGGQNG